MSAYISSLLFWLVWQVMWDYVMLSFQQLAVVSTLGGGGGGGGFMLFFFLFFKVCLDKIVKVWTMVSSTECLDFHTNVDDLDLMLRSLEY